MSVTSRKTLLSRSSRRSQETPKYPARCTSISIEGRNITGKKHYPGSYPVYFNITPIDLEDVTADNIAVAYNGKVQKKIPTLSWNGKKLVNRKDFTVSYPNGADAYQEEGDYEVLVTAKNGGNFTGEKTIRLSIVNPDDYKLISKATVKKIPAQQYTGGPIELDSDELKVTFKGVGTLLEGEDYDVEYENNTAVGTATALIQGTGDYIGTKRVTFQIKGKSLKKPSITGFTLQKSMVYNGEEQEQDTSRMKVAVNGDSLTEGTDYEILYSNNKNAGKAILTIQGVNEYAGTVKKSFKITAYDLKEDSDHMIKGLEEAVTEKLTSGRATPKPQLAFGNKTLVEGRDYTVSYKNNRKAATADDNKAPTIIIKGKGNFKGIITKTFTITE